MPNNNDINYILQCIVKPSQARTNPFNCVNVVRIIP